MTKLLPNGISYGTMDFTVERYHAMIESGLLGPEDRVELLYGKITPTSPVGRFHAASVAALNEVLSPPLVGRFTFRVQDPITILPQSEPEPDYVIARYDADRYASGHPTPEDVILLIEVSDSTLDKDRQYKLPLYAAHGIKEYWILNLVDRRFEIYTDPDNLSDYASSIIYEEGATFTHPILGEVDTKQFLPRIDTIRRT